MKIGIVTWFGGVNYGTNLQAIALQHYLKAQGHSVELLNFQIKSNIKSKKSLWKKITNQPEKYINKYFFKKYKKDIANKLEKIEGTLINNCDFTGAIKTEQDYIEECNRFDLLVFGSDQIWNPNWYHKYYYANYPSIKSKRVSYAPSLGIDYIPYEKEEIIKRSLENFETISVREKSGARLLENLTGKKVETVLDPTLLLNADEWSEFTTDNKFEERYVLSLFLDDKVSHWHAAQKYAKKKGMKHVVIPYLGYSYMKGDYSVKNAGIEDFLTLIKNAEFVLTDSFHVTVLSIIFNKQFVSFKRFKNTNNKSQNTRLEDMLKLFNLEEQLIPYNSKNIPEIFKIDYESTNRIVNKKISESKEYLKRILD